MPRKTTVTGYIVKVAIPMTDWDGETINGLQQRSPRAMLTDAEVVRDGIRKHLGKSASIESEVAHTREHCGSPWTTDEPTFNGACCDKDDETAQEAMRRGELGFIK